MKIALLDDKEFGLVQIKNAMPVGVEAEFFYFDKFSDFDKDDTVFDILFLDYFLDKDQITSDQIFCSIGNRANIIISFSSSSSANKKMLGLGVDFTVTKMWDDYNDELDNLLLEVLG